MPFDPYKLLMQKWSADAESEIAQRLSEKRQRVLSERRYHLAKKSLLFVALGAVACAVYFREHIGGLAAEMTSRAPDPTLVASPSMTKAKVARKMAEIQKQKEDELDEVMQ